MKAKNLKYYPNGSNESFSFDHVHIKYDKQVPMHQQETWELAYIVTGSGIRIIGDIVENFSEGEVILIPPDVPHCWSFDANVYDKEGKIENICIFINPDFFENFKICFPEFGHLISEIQENPHALSFSGETLKNLQDLMKNMKLQNKMERLSSLLLILEKISSSKNLNIVGSRTEERKNEKKLHEIYMFILNNFHRNIELGEVSEVAGMPKSTFCLFFKKMTGKSFMTYLTNFRIESACQMLLKTKLSISEICVSSGFNDIPYFNRTFKKIKNVTPGEFRIRY
ncbi:AraC family transcriptional regulator [Chryseobacterium sp.]|uniref:AraC family transcriptional regulator n=1 Tax=Chryseobacterium sp. TaxID=1871047 RepID=UPI00289DE418|nr:AraC family transcriptional regulator [Chryseobacterium sp.]